LSLLSHRDCRRARRIPSIGVPAVLAAYRFEDPASARAQATHRFITRLLDLAADPKEGLGRPEAGFNKNWCGVDLTAPVQIWRRHEAVLAWIEANQATRPPHPTRIVCPSSEVPRRAFCATPASINAEFSQRWLESGKVLQPAEPSYMEAYNTFVRQECP
jgi:hypothetical protein